jgi:hypothetical protein
MQVAITAPQTLRGMFPVGQDMAKVLAPVAPCKASLGSVLLYLDILIKAIQFEYLLRFYISQSGNNKLKNGCHASLSIGCFQLTVICLILLLG